MPIIRAESHEQMRTPAPCDESRIRPTRAPKTPTFSGTPPRNETAIHQCERGASRVCVSVFIFRRRELEAEQKKSRGERVEYASAGDAPSDGGTKKRSGKVAGGA